MNAMQSDRKECRSGILLEGPRGEKQGGGERSTLDVSGWICDRGELEVGCFAGELKKREG
jgi:hypothetical protein